MAHLKEFEKRRPGRRALELSAKWRGVHTPLTCQDWEEQLKHNSDKWSGKLDSDKVSVGFCYWEQACRGTSANMKSAEENPQVVHEYLVRKLELGRVLAGLLGQEECQVEHVNWIVVIPKSYQLGKWRLTVDLFHPEGSSINDGIKPKLCSLHNTSVNKAVMMVSERGTGIVMAKFDIEST